LVSYLNIEIIRNILLATKFENQNFEKDIFLKIKAWNKKIAFIKN